MKSSKIPTASDRCRKKLRPAVGIGTANFADRRVISETGQRLREVAVEQGFSATRQLVGSLMI